MLKPIVLWQSERTVSTDDAGVVIISSTSPPKAYFQPGSYHDEDSLGTTRSRFPERLRSIPPLSYFCIKCLVQFPELIYHYGPPRPYRPPAHPSDSDILQVLIPRNQQGHFDLSKLDPRLWAIVVQVYSDLPRGLQIYHTALSDKYIPLLQHVPATEHFSLLTVLELPGCSNLNDDTVVHLKVLHTLCVLDASRSALSAIGIRRLSGTLRWVEDDDAIDSSNPRRGPWQLRILRLRGCKRVTNAIYQYFESFVLLAAVDLRGTSCTWDREKIPPSFFPAVDKRLYYPTSPLEALSLLSNSQGVHPSSDSGVLHIDRLTHASRERCRSFELVGIGFSVTTEDSNAALQAYRTAICSPEFSASPSSPQWTPNFRRPPHLCPADEPPQGSMEEPKSGETDPYTMRAVVATESDADAQYKASRKTVDSGSSVAHPPRHMQQWGEELLMLYREPPPWDQVQLSPIVKFAPRPRSHEEPMSVDRTNERAMKGVQEMQDMLSERRRSAKEAHGIRNGVRASTKLSVPRNPFAVPFGGSSTHVCERPSNESSPHTSVMVAPPRPLRSLKPISALPVPIPPDSSGPVTGKNGQDSTAVPGGPRRSQDSSWSSRPVSSPVNQLCDQSCKTGRIAERVEPAAARKRLRSAVFASGNKRQKQDESGSRPRGFDWSSWSTSR